MKKIVIQINKDGSINAKTLGMKGKSCMDYLNFLTTIVEADVLDSDFTQEYYENDKNREQVLTDINL
jgi:hypothetical protein